MAFLPDLLYRLRVLTRRRRMEEELSAELQHHLATQAARYQALGATPEAARRRALLDLGGLEDVKERTRDVRGTSTLDTGMQDLRYSIRSLLRAPGFTIAAIVALGLGIGSATAVFSLLEGVVLRPLPYREPNRLVTLVETKVDKGLTHELMSPVNFVDYRGLSRTFQDAAGWWRTEFVLDGEAGGDPARVKGVEATANFLTVLGVQPLFGAGFSGDPELRALTPQVLISHRLWLSRFGGDRGVVGRQLRLNGGSFTVIGVMPAGFDYPHNTELWQGLNWNLSQHSRGAHFWEGVARLAPGVTESAANRDLATLTAGLGQSFKPTNDGWSARVVRLDLEITGTFRPALFALLGAAALLLLIACINVANLLLARGATRQREVALRSAIGANRGRVVRLFLTESLLLAGAGALLGLVIAVAGVRGLLAWSPVDIPRAGEIGVNGWVLGFATLVSLLTAVGFGLAPALASVRSSLTGALREGGRGSGSRSNRARGGLVVAEVALAVMLLCGAGVVMRSVAGLLNEDIGASVAGSVTAQVQLPNNSYSDYVQVDQFYERLMEALRSRREITEVGRAYYLPLDAAYRLPFGIAGAAAPPGGDPVTAQYHSVDDGYFGVLRARLLSGRNFAKSDDANAPAVVIVNRAFVRQQFPDGNAIGQRITTTVRNIGPLGSRIVAGNEHEIVGIVEDVKNTSLREPAEPAIYFSARQFPYRTMHVVMRGSGDPVQLAAVLQSEVRRLDPALAIGQPSRMEEVLAGAIDPPRLLRMLLAVFAILALTLAAVGIYGVLTFAVASRRREMSVRIALGAEPRGVLWMVVREGLVLTLAGFGLGILGVVAAGRSISGFLYGVSSWDPMTIGAVLAVLLVVAGAACFAPGRRASREDPADALRAE